MSWSILGRSTFFEVIYEDGIPIIWIDKSGTLSTGKYVPKGTILKIEKFEYEQVKRKYGKIIEAYDTKFSRITTYDGYLIPAETISGLYADWLVMSALRALTDKEINEINKQITNNNSGNTGSGDSTGNTEPTPTLKRWNDDLIKIKEFTIVSPTKLYSANNGALSSSHKVTIPSSPSVTVTVEYDEKLDAMKITGPNTDNVKKYLGYYIKDPATVVKPTQATAQTTTEARQEQIKIQAEAAKETTKEENVVTEEIETDESFNSFTTELISANEYEKQLSEGLDIKDLRGIMGLPHQFLPVADPRITSSAEGSSIGETNKFGRVYSEKVLKHIPLLLMTPGVPKFMSQYNKKSRESMLSAIFNNDGLDNYAPLKKKFGLDGIFGEKMGKFYSLMFAYTEYYYYVNAMLRAAAVFLGISGKTIDGKKIAALNWEDQTGTMSNDVLYDNKFSKFLKPYANAVAFYVDAGTTVDDSFSNGTTESSLVAGTVNGLSDSAREYNFLLGSVGSSIGFQYDALQQQEATNKINDVITNIDKALGKTGIFSRILGNGTAILAGGRIIFPEIWSDSSFSRSYSCSMKLVSPSGDKLSVFWNILVPIYHLLAFTLPREATDQAYFSPFLVRAYYKGLFNVDMGIVTSLNITKGEEGEWTPDGIPTVANISFEIKDLYNGIYMSKQNKTGDARGILTNTAELDYIANSCGININDQEIGRMIKLGAIYFGTTITDAISLGIFTRVGQFFNQKMNNIFGRFK